VFAHAVAEQRRRVDRPRTSCRDAAPIVKQFDHQSDVNICDSTAITV
jgi:hypothetical protein